MATYYVRNDGNNANTGTGSATTQAWQTIAYAFANMTLTTGTNYLYIAPGVYRESVTLTVTPTASNTLVISGDPTASQFSGISPGQVRITGATTDSSASANGTRINTNSKPYVTLQDLVIEGASGSGLPLIQISGTDSVVNRLIGFAKNTGGATSEVIKVVAPNTTGNNIVVKNCIVVTNSIGITCTTPTATSGVSGITIQNCRLLIGSTATGFFISPQSGTTMSSVLITNSFVHGAVNGVYVERGNTTNKHTIQNCIFSCCTTGINAFASNTTVQSNNIINAGNELINVPTDATTVYSDFLGVDFGQTLLQSFGNLALFGSLPGSRNTGFGTSSNAPATDAYGITWTGLTPDVGAVTYRSLTGASFYTPTERNASTITIAPGSTSQSIELYLGATGLTASTIGLTARYNRTRTASVSIPLVARTIAQAWTSGGFAEVDATNMPGIYRLDLPDAALAAGADDVTIVVRGASGTNGAVMTIKLSSGGLTSAQTASAVLDAVSSSYVTAGSIGYAIQNSNVASISGSTAAADELEGALLHNGTDYISAELVTPVTSAALVRMGPFEVKADGLGASDPLDIQKGAQHGIDIQCVDNNGAGIDITSATVTAKVYNSGATLVDTYSCTATYAADGRATFTIDTTVTNVPGTYTATITRTTGASDTQIFGPLRIYVRDI